MDKRSNHGFSRQFMAMGVLLPAVFIPDAIPGAIRSYQKLLSISNGEPVIRLTGGVLTPFFMLLTFPIFAGMTAFYALHFAKKTEWIDYLKSKVPITQKGWTAIVLMLLVLLFINPIVTRMVMPRYGYHICQKLDGGLSMWHNDWVQNPDWCVRGKTHEWVRAMAAREAGADVDPDEVQRKAKSRENEPPTRASKWFFLFVGFWVGAVLWVVEFRYWESFRRRHALLRWPLLGAAGLVAGFLTFICMLFGYATGGDAHWAGLLGLAFAVSWPVFGFLDERAPPEPIRPLAARGRRG